MDPLVVELCDDDVSELELEPGDPDSESESCEPELLPAVADADGALVTPDEPECDDAVSVVFDLDLDLDSDSDSAPADLLLVAVAWLPASVAVGLGFASAVVGTTTSPHEPPATPIVVQ